MPHLANRSRLWIILSGILFATALIFVHFYLAWVCLIPLFYTLGSRKAKQVFADGILFGLVAGGLLFYWMPGVVADFTGGSMLFGIGAYLIALIFAALYFGLLLLAFAKLKPAARSGWSQALLAASLWTCGEWLLATFKGMPWFGFHIGNMLLRDLFAIQFAAFGGVLLISFFVVFVNYLAAHFIRTLQWKRLVVPVVMIFLYQLAGYGIYALFVRREAGLATKPFSVALLCENTPPDVKWDQHNGDFMAKQMLALNARMTALRPDIAVWTESAVPWTYSAEDPFVREVIRTSSPQGITHIMGINTDYKDEVVFNSAYCLQPDGKVAGRYDKRFLLALVEKPLGAYALPFLSTDGFYARAGEEAHPLPTFKGKAGVLICNEATVDDAAIDLVHNGATFLVNISNDGWFSEIPYLVNQHFYNARLRAVEVRKDMAVNSNMGISGKIDASGEAEQVPASSGGYVSKILINGNNFITLYSEYKLMTIFLVTISLLYFLAKRLFSPFKNSP